RWRASASGKKNPQLVEELFFGLTFVICREPFQCSADQGFRPAAIENQFFSACGSVILKKRFRLFDLLFMQRQKTLSATTLERMFAVGSIREEIFQRGQQELTEPALLPIDAGIDFMFDQVYKKTLSE